MLHWFTSVGVLVVVWAMLVKGGLVRVLLELYADLLLFLGFDVGFCGFYLDV